MASNHLLPTPADGGGDDSDSDSETTPLLHRPAETSSQVAPKKAGGNGSIAAATQALAAPAVAPSQDKPLPVGQIMLLCYARLIEPLAFFSIFPYINQMVQENGGLEDADVGFYSGLIESLFSLTQMSVMMLWGKAADRLGRKPVLVFSLIGVSFAVALFGLAHTIWQMIFFRCIAGFFTGTIVTIRTMISEHSTSKTQARTFSWFAFTGNLGIFVGPFIGGALADPAGQYPRAFRGVQFFEDYPYALGSIVVGCIGLTAVATSALFIEETLPPHRRSSLHGGGGQGEEERGGENGNENGHENGNGVVKPPSYLDLIKYPGVGIVLWNYGHAMLLAFAYTAIIPVFWFTSVELGGFEFDPLLISVFMGLTGLSQAVWLLVFFPPLQRRVGTNGVMRVCGIAYPIFMAIQPLLNLVLRLRTPAGDTAFWILASLTLAIGPGVSMAFTGVQLALNDVSPDPAMLSMLNALALTITSALRSFSPALFASLYAVGVGQQWLWGYFAWAICVVLAVGFTIATRYLPASGEKSAEETVER
ncbi:MFS general substrate transporter [Xylariomycetidae sp. FL2044]|nr:MFS general substrate transporter [Xylariomycetidae sp. FL2044]